MAPGPMGPRRGAGPGMMGPRRGMGMGAGRMFANRAPVAVVVVADGVVYVACDGRLTAFDAKTLKKLGQATYWRPRPAARGAAARRGARAGARRGRNAGVAAPPPGGAQ